MIKRFDMHGNAHVAGAYCFYEDAEARIAELEAQLKVAQEDVESYCSQNTELMVECAAVKSQLKTAKRDALQKLADGLEIPPTKEGPFVWGYLHSQIMNEIEDLDANTIGKE